MIATDGNKKRVMNKEITYTKNVSAEHIKKLGQYFTNYDVARFMSYWACRSASSVLDPAVGNSVFLSFAKEINPACSLNGYEIDKDILEFFGNPSNANIINDDYLLNGWEDQYDAIVCNPPYNRFQAVSNRKEILESIYTHTGIKYSRYTNLYILFLIKSIYQLSEKGHLAYIIPSEFLNSKYGTPVKQLLIDKKLLRAIINFENDKEMFFNATTTCCILLLDYLPKTHVSFYNLNSVKDLTNDIFTAENDNSIKVSYDKLKAEDKWRSYIKQEENAEYSNLIPVSEFCSVSRGIATGANDFFCFSMSKALAYNIPEDCLTKCICHSADVKSIVFDSDDFDTLKQADKTVFVLDVTEEDSLLISAYIEYGLQQGIDKKLLPSCRKPWYSMEQRLPAPIWVSSACRNGVKFVRNAAMIKSLTTFHSIYIHPEYEEYTDIIFCYFITPIAQSILRENRKELGNGLEKFQPNDLNSAQMLDIRKITLRDKEKIIGIYNQVNKKSNKYVIDELDSIFANYLKNNHRE